MAASLFPYTVKASDQDRIDKREQARIDKEQAANKEMAELRRQLAEAKESAKIAAVASDMTQGKAKA